MPNKQIAQSFFAVPVADLRKQVEALSNVILHQRNLNRIVRDFERGRNISVSEISRNSRQNVPYIIYTLQE
jgi:hypothetical protein